MKDMKIRLTDSEVEVMEVLWANGNPMRVRNIIETLNRKEWADSNYYRIINSLERKKAIEVVGSVLTVRAHARLYRPTIGREEYSLSTLENAPVMTQNTITTMVSSFIKKSDKETAEQLMSDLEKIIDDMRKEKK